MKLEQKIEFHRIRQSIINKCSTDFASKLVENEKISFSKEEIERRLNLTEEMKHILMFETSFPGSGFIDCLDFLIPLNQEFSCIDLVSLKRLQTALNTLRKILFFFSKTKENQYPHLKKMAEPINQFPEVLNRIDNILDRFGNVKDNASADLLDIRRSIHNTENTVSRKMQSIMKRAIDEGIADNDAQISVRDGRILIPVSVGNKNKISGFIYDESASGKTAFIEPVEVTELNNQIKDLHFAEKREIQKILSDYTEFLRPYLPEIIDSAKFMGNLDFISAKASVSINMVAGKPIVSTDGGIMLMRARHPLLEASLKKENKKIVPLDIRLHNDKRILLISGPNAGGKSVCLKTLGLLQYMFQWGLLIPAAETSEMGIFDNIFIDIGDDQSIDNDLSTYSSFLLNMKDILKNATNRSLVLIDEFGSGTDPAAGGPIAEEILSELEKRNSYGVITTHYSNLKFYAGKSQGIINGAMLFDTSKLEPLYKLEIGLPGNSFAFELARKMGLPENIVHAAELRAGTDYVNIERNLRKIARNKRNMDEHLARIKNTDRKLENITDKYEQELNDINKLKKDIIAEAKREAKEILSQANKKIEATIKDIRESQADKEKTKIVRNNLNEFVEKIKKEEDANANDLVEKKMEQLRIRKERQAQRKQDKEKELNNPKSESKPMSESKPKAKEIIAVGSKVRFKSNGMVGEVSQVSDKMISVSVGNIISKISPKKVEIISSNDYKQVFDDTPRPHSNVDMQALNDRKLNFKPSIDIRGMRLEEAIGVINNFIDDALMVNISQVSILHGKGNGVLREEIRKILHVTHGVKSYRDENIQNGGSGITIVEFDN